MPGSCPCDDSAAISQSVKRHSFCRDHPWHFHQEANLCSSLSSLWAKVKEGVQPRPIARSWERQCQDSPSGLQPRTLDSPPPRVVLVPQAPAYVMRAKELPEQPHPEGPTEGQESPRGLSHAATIRDWRGNLGLLQPKYPLQFALCLAKCREYLLSVE